MLNRNQILVQNLLITLLISSSGFAADTTHDIKILSSRAAFLTFSPMDTAEKIVTGNFGYGKVLNTRYCELVRSQISGALRQDIVDCNNAIAGALNRPAINQSETVEVYFSDGKPLPARNSGYLYQVTGLIRTSAFDATSFRGIGLHAHNVSYWEAKNSEQWGFLVGENNAKGGFLSKQDMMKTIRKVTLKNGEIAYTFEFVLSQVHLVTGASKPTYLGMTVRPNVKHTSQDKDFVLWDNVESDYYLANDFDRSNELLK